MAGEHSRQVLGDYFTLQRGTTYKSRLLGQPGPILLGLATIQRNGGFRADSLKTYGGESPARLLVQPGDLYLSLKDVTQSADLLGAVARLPRDHPPGRLTQDTVKLEPKNPDVPVDYLYWLLRTPQYRSYCRAHATGTTNLGLAREDFLAFPAPEPTPIQHRVVETLRALEEKIEVNRLINETLEAIVRALFKSWFVDFDPVRVKAKKRDTGLPEHIADLFPDSFENSELGEIPRGWPIVGLGDVAEICKGVGYDSKGLDAVNAKRLHNLNSVQEGGGYKYSGLKMWAGEHKKKHEVSAGDVVVASVEQGHDRLLLGFAAQIPEGLDGLASQDLFVVRSRDRRTTRDYIAHLINVKLQPNISGYATGTTVNHLPMQALTDQQFALPQQTLVEYLGGAVAKIRNMTEMLREECRTLAAIRDSLLPKLIAGEVRATGSATHSELMT